MLVALHVAFALTSLIIATVSMFFPSKTILKFTFFSTLGAFISGIALGFLYHSDITKSCISGSVYLGFIIISSLITRRRLATRVVKSPDL